MLEQSGPVIPASVDRRRSERHERKVSAWLSDASGGGVASSQQQVIVSNLSLHGIGFTAPNRVELEDFHWIVIASGQLSLSTRIRVINVRQNADGAFEVGAEFY